MKFVGEGATDRLEFNDSQRWSSGAGEGSQRLTSFCKVFRRKIRRLVSSICKFIYQHLFILSARFELTSLAWRRLLYATSLPIEFLVSLLAFDPKQHFRSLLISNRSCVTQTTHSCNTSTSSFTILSSILSFELKKKGGVNHKCDKRFKTALNCYKKTIMLTSASKVWLIFRQSLLWLRLNQAK